MENVNNEVLTSEQAKNTKVNFIGMETSVSTLKTIATVTTIFTAVIATNWILEKYFDIHVLNMFGGGDDAETEV